MKVFVSRSKDGKPSPVYEQAIRAAGWELLSDDTALLPASDALLVCISGAENRDLKAELNMALDRKIPVAYVPEEKGTADSGLLLQLGLAVKIGPEAPQEEIPRWLEQVKAKKEKKQKKQILKIILLSVLAAGTAAALWTGISRQKVKAEQAEANAAEENPAAAETPALSDAEKYLGPEPEKLTELDLSGLGLTDISFLSKAENLEKLDLSNNAIEDVNVLVTLEKLKEVDLSGNPIEDDTILDFMEGVNIIR